MADSQIDELLKQLQDAEAVEGTRASIERTLPDGTKVTGKDYDELFTNVEAHYSAKPKEETKAPIPFPVQSQAKVESPAPKQERLDINLWAQTLQQDPVAAQEMIDKIRFGGDPVAKIHQLEQMLQAQIQQSTAKEIRSWQKNNKEIDLKVHGTVLDNLLKTQNLAINEENLDFVVGQAQQYGWITKGAPAATAKVAPAPPPVAPQTTASFAKTGPGVALVTELLKKLDDPDLTPDQRRSLMVQAGMFDPGSESKLNNLG